VFHAPFTTRYITLMSFLPPRGYVTHCPTIPWQRSICPVGAGGTVRQTAPAPAIPAPDGGAVEAYTRGSPSTGEVDAVGGDNGCVTAFE
jgi:hypothetical protein